MFKSIVLFVTLSFTGFTALAEDIPTRFGSLNINDGNMLLFKNRPLNPAIQGHKSLGAVGVYQVGNSDVVLIQDNVGSGCPDIYYFVTVSGSGVKATSAFGTCSELFEVKQVSDSISVTMTGFMGPFESEAAKKRAAKEKHVFVLKAGVLTKNGKPIK